MNELSMSMFATQKDYWKARAERAEAAIKQQAQTFKIALDNAKKDAAHMLARAEQLNAESRPDLIESEREANALLTERIEQLEAQIEKARELVQKWRQEATEPDSSFAGVWLPVAAKEFEAALAQSQEASQ